MEFTFKAALFLGIVTLSCAFDSSDHCPIQRASSPCKCKHGTFYEEQGTIVECRDIDDVDTLYEEIQRFRAYEIDYFKLIKIRLPYLPGGAFMGTFVKRLYILNSHLDNLYKVDNASLTQTPFDGLELRLTELMIKDTTDPSKWYWPNMRNLNNLKEVYIMNSPIDFVGHIFAEIGEGSLENIYVQKSRVYRIHPQAFPELTNLRNADFEGNFLPYLVRTMFPNPAPKLKLLNFRRNRLFTLNENMFENMPALKDVDFSENEFKTFESKVFTPIWSQLNFFFMSENPFHCDCSLQPLKEKLTAGTLPQVNDINRISCVNPGQFKKTFLKDLDFTSLLC